MRLQRPHPHPTKRLRACSKLCPPPGSGIDQHPVSEHRDHLQLRAVEYILHVLSAPLALKSPGGLGATDLLFPPLPLLCPGGMPFKQPGELSGSNPIFHHGFFLAARGHQTDPFHPGTQPLTQSSGVERPTNPDIPLPALLLPLL